MKIKFKREKRTTERYIVMMNSLGCILQSSTNKDEAKNFPNECSSLIRKMIKTFYRMKGEEVELEAEYGVESD